MPSGGGGIPSGGPWGIPAGGACLTTFGLERSKDEFVIKRSNEFKLTRFNASIGGDGNPDGGLGMPGGNWGDLLAYSNQTIS